MKTIICCALLVLLVPASVFAGRELGLKEAINQALEHNNLLKAAGYERIAAGQGAAATYSRHFPRIYLEESATASNAPPRVFMMKLDEGRFGQNDFAVGNLNNPSWHGDFRTSVTLEVPIYDPSIRHGVELAASEEKGHNLTLARRRQEVAFMVYSDYLEVQKSRGNLKAAEQAVADAREHQRLAAVRSEAGTGLKSDELRARTFLGQMELQSIAAGNALALARLRLAQAIGAGAGEAVDIREEPGPLPLNAGNEELHRLAVENRLELQELATGVEKGAIGVQQARGAYLPTLYGTAAYQMNDRDIPFGRDNDSWVVGATLRWEMFDGLRRRSEKGKAEALRDAAAEYLENYRKEIAVQVEECRLRREEAGKRLEVGRHSVLDAEEVVRLISRRYENSLATFVDLLDAQTDLNRVRAELIGSESDYARATARLYHATGTFLKEVLR